MVIESERGKLIFRKMQRDLLRLARDPRPEAVHNFRTTSRRLETLLEQLLPACDRNQKKLLKLLSRIRKRAGKIRDLDVQLAALRSFRVPQEPRRKTQLAQRLIELRAEHEGKLQKLMKKRRIGEIKKRIKRGLQTLVLSSSRDPLVVARQILTSASATGPLTDDV